jgi:spore germination protein YaaH
MIIKHIQKVGVYALVMLLASPSVGFAVTEDSFETSGWIPYWRAQKGVESALPNLSALSEINPFIYSVKKNGDLFVSDPLEQERWQTLRVASELAGIRFIPTVMWANADAMDEVFRDETKRRAHVRSIVAEVFKQNLDGIDIDYEAKYARTRPYFSLFLRDLYNAMGYNKWIVCTIEARTPLDSRYSSPEAIPSDIEFANDFTEINKYCNRVRIMAYDQGRIDLKLNKENSDPYIPVADAQWVRKVMELASKEIDNEKLVIGVPTYGYEYDMFLDSDGDIRYSRLWSFNPGYAKETQDALGISPVRNSAGELFLTYPASQSLDPAIPLPNATRVMSWSDSEAIRQKIELAKELGLRGVAVFKFDGGEDQGVWSVLKEHIGGVQKIANKVVDKSVNDEVFVTVPKFTQDLEFGDIHEEVRDLQKYLNAIGFTVAKNGPGSVGKETNYFGPATKNAVIRFQKKYRVSPAIGYVGPKTRKTMKSL